METKKISIIIPCFNEEATIAEVLNGIPNLPEIYEIIVVDDGSKDKTVACAKQSAKNPIIISHPYNIGNGAAVKTGAKIATGDFILLLDGDGQHNSADMVKLIQGLENYDLIIGARNKKSNVSNFRSIGNFIFNRLASYLAQQKILDLTSGFRLINREKFLEFYDLYPNQYSYPTTSTLAFIKSGYFVKFIEIETIKKREKGKSKIKPVSDGMKFINIIVKIIIMFSPMRFFFPVFVFFFLISISVASYQLGANHKLSSTSVILFLFSFQIFFIGLVTDQISYLFKKK